MVPQVYISLVWLSRGGGVQVSGVLRGEAGGWAEGGVLGKLEVEVGTE